MSIIFTIVASICLLLHSFSAFAKPKNKQSLEEGVSPKTKQERYTDMYKKLHNIVTMTENGFYKSIEANDVFTSMAKGLLSGIDPYSAYLTAEEYESIKSNILGKFAGIGIEIGKDKGFIKIISPIDDTPGQKAGLKSGDYIVKIDGQNLYDRSTFDVLKMLRGESGTTINLTIVRGDNPKPIEFAIKRDIIKVTPIKPELFNNVFYAKITSFTENAYEEFIKAITVLTKQPEAIILDLRYNPGGEIEQAIMISDLFLPQDKTIVSVKGRNNDYFTVDKKNFQKFDSELYKPSNIKIVSSEDEIVFKSSKDVVVPLNIPVIIITNEGSASASEILTAALQQNNRAVVIGEKTYGKGSVQSVIPIDGGKQGAVKLTIAKYYTPNGSSIHEIGIMPDIIEKARISPEQLLGQTSTQSSSQAQVQPTIQSITQPMQINAALQVEQNQQTKTDRPELSEALYAKLQSDNQLWIAYTIAKASITQSKIIVGGGN